MKQSTQYAQGLVARRPDRYADVAAQYEPHRDNHRCTVFPPTPLSAREIGVFVRAMHASYVLELGTGLGYGGLHVAASFGATGRLDTIEIDPTHAAIAAENFRRFALEERVRLNQGAAHEVISALSGPYDLVVMDCDWADYPPLYEDIVRLVRTGGSIILANVAPLGWEIDGEAALPDANLLREFLERLADDDRLLASFGPALTQVVATRLR